ncbi:hypothetical protein SEA_PICKLES13_4 [Microbacterium phage Pickles13]|nr:hypothetical protein SEA_PICKLES13_4 [Microbacterium phage Pickles13]
MMWVAEITLRVRIGRKRAQQHESSETPTEPPSIFESQGAAIELDGAPVARLAPPIGFHPAPEDAARSDTSRKTPPTAR